MLTEIKVTSFEAAAIIKQHENNGKYTPTEDEIVKQYFAKSKCITKIFSVAHYGCSGLGVSVQIDLGLPSLK